MELVVVDLETTGLQRGRDEIIEIGAVEWKDGVLGESFHTLVRPDAPPSDEIMKLTGIPSGALASAPDLGKTLPQFFRFLKGRRIAGHNAWFDFQFLQAGAEQAGYDLPIPADPLDTLLLSYVCLPLQRDHRLAAIAHACGVNVDTTHRGLADARLAAELLTHLQNTAAQFPYLTLQSLERLAALVSPVTAEWFAEAADRRLSDAGTDLPEGCSAILQLAYREAPGADGEAAATADPPPPSDGAWDGSAIASEWFGEHSPLRQALSSFEVRPGQQQMVNEVSHALQNDHHLVVEAGTGTGKSLAYLIPAAFFSRSDRSKVVVSTETVSLQDQIASRDFPMLRRVSDQPVRLAVFKGRTHYLCLRKLHQELSGVGIGVPRPEVETYMTLLGWLVQTSTGTREELPLHGRMNEVWQRIQSETESCINKRCPFFRPCYYFRARARAFDADIVVTNHSLVLSDMKADHRVLPHYDRIVIDEAHHLEQQATRHLGDEVQSGRMAASFGRLLRDHGRHGVVPELISRLDAGVGGEATALAVLAALQELLPSFKQAVDAAFAALASLIAPGQTEWRIHAHARQAPAWQDYQDGIERLGSLIPELSDAAERLQEAADTEADTVLSGRLFDASGFARDLIQQAGVLCRAGEADENWVVWVERTGPPDRPQHSLHRAPIDVAPLLQEMLFNEKDSVVLTSATLSAAGDFGYLQRQLGLSLIDPDRVRTVTVPSPFDYPQQALLCVPNDMPELAKMQPLEAATWLAPSLTRLASASGGRMLVLFTSHALLRATAAAAREPLQAAGFRLLAQGIDGNRTRLLESFRADPAAVLFGAQSFWEGIDLPGDQLTTLAIVRLPFSPPSHPVTAARHERITEAGQSSFWSDSLPEAVMRFRQGFGRLIRTTTDRGVVVVYDRRIVSSSYGRNFIRSLDGVRPFVASEERVIERVRRFLEAEA